MVLLEKLRFCNFRKCRYQFKSFYENNFQVWNGNVIQPDHLSNTKVMSFVNNKKI